MTSLNVTVHDVIERQVGWRESIIERNFSLIGVVSSTVEALLDEVDFLADMNWRFFASRESREDFELELEAMDEG